ncbi:MAG TPA: terminase large subunit [Mycobacterium sp.]|uniref:terminase large subunit domain-containing protein n=1 Tax=Mycobacterium sp. TaxID=1785 RepID=UPI002F42B992
MPEETKWTERNTDGLRTCDFIGSTIRLTKGAARGELVQLRMWQGDIICDALRLNANGVRMYTTYEIFIGRKNSKSLIGGGLALDGLFDEPGAEVYSCAGSREQAALVYNEVVAAVEMSPELSRHLRIYRSSKTIEYAKTGSIYKVLSSESSLQEGLNPSRVIFDELHTQKDDDLWNVMNQGSDTRDQPLVVVITTKGVANYSDGTPTICRREYDRVKKVMSGEEKDLRLGGRIYETVLKKTDNYLNQKHWPDANPALGDFLHLDNMADRAKRLPEADFKAKRLNIWVQQTTSWLRDGKWDKLGRPRRAPIPGERAVVQFDGSFRNDSTAITAWLLGGPKPHLTLLGLWEKPDKAVDWHVPIGEVNAILPALFRRTPVEPGGKVDGRFLQLRWDLNVECIVFDPARYLETFRTLEEDGVPVVEYPNTAARMVPATQLFYDGVMGEAFTHDGHPALARHADNCSTKLTSAGVMLDKKNARAHIDGIVCSVFGYDIATQRVVADVPAATSSANPDAAGGNPFRNNQRLRI